LKGLRLVIGSFHNRIHYWPFPFSFSWFFIKLILFTYIWTSLLNWGLLPTVDGRGVISYRAGRSQSLLNWGLLPTTPGLWFRKVTRSGMSQSLLNWGLLPTEPHLQVQGAESGSQSLLNWGLLPTHCLSAKLPRTGGRNPFLTEVFFLLIEMMTYHEPGTLSQSLLNWGLLPTSPLTGEVVIFDHRSQSLLNWGLLPTWMSQKSLRSSIRGRNPFLTEVFFLQGSRS